MQHFQKQQFGTRLLALGLLVLAGDLLLLVHLRLGIEELPAEQDDHRQDDREKQIAVVFFHHGRKRISLGPVKARRGQACEGVPRLGGGRRLSAKAASRGL